MKNKKAFISIFFLLLFCSGFFMFCNDPEDEADQDENANVSIQRGKALSGRFCQSCHMLPDPALLDKENWQVALGMMAPRLGIYDHNGKRYTIYTDIDQSSYPDKAAMSSQEWQNIIDYYTAASPAVMPPQKKAKMVKTQLPFFSIKYPSPLFFRKGYMASFIKIDTSVQPRRIFVNMTPSNMLFLFNDKLDVVDSFKTSGPIVDIDFNGNELTACKIGSDLLGNNSKLGGLIPLRIINQHIRANGPSLFDTLLRPIHVTSVDLNSDRKKDYLVSEFGNMFGSLSWMENKSGKKYIRHNIRAVPGATKTIIQDYNHDGRPDIWAQFAQGEEGIFLFTNTGNGLFTEKQVIRLPPSYGSSSFELADFNHDGFSDIVYTCGDRGDGVNQLKPYHGVYVFLNNGKNEFAQQYFYPINGCIKAMAKDFDSDGDLDIAAIGFFTDFGQPEEGFTYLENKGNFNFQPYALPLTTKFRRATTMDVADLNNDGKPDIILGQGFIGNKTINNKEPLFIVLMNQF